MTNKTPREMMSLTIEWAKKAGFYDSTTSEIQLEKFCEEHEEVLYAVKGYWGQLAIKDTEVADLAAMADIENVDQDAYWLEKIKDGVGDSMVTYFIQCGLRGLSPTAIRDPATLGCFATHYSLSIEGLTLELAEFIDALRASKSDSTTVVHVYQSTNVATWIGHLFGFTPTECFDHAYAIINNRIGKGKVVDGIFVKEGDLPLNNTSEEDGYCEP